MAKYGHHHDQIARFLSRVKTLTESDWIGVSEARAQTFASFGSRSYHDLERELEAYKEFGVAGANNLVGQAFDDAGINLKTVARGYEKDRAQKQALVLEALHGLLHANNHSAVEFTRAYLPFEGRIPVADLGFVAPPRVLAAPSTVEGRFATRVLALDANNWDDAFVISKFVDSIVGEEAIEEGWASIEELAAGMTDETASSLNTALEILEDVGMEHLNQMSSIYQGMARVISREDWVESRMQQHRDQVAELCRMATRALVAVALIDRAEEHVFATFYAPFGTLITVGSLSTKS